jgi:uncharacterized protein YcfL
MQKDKRPSTISEMTIWYKTRGVSQNAYYRAPSMQIGAREGRSMSPNQSMRNGAWRAFLYFKACIDAIFKVKYENKYDATT